LFPFPLSSSFSFSYFSFFSSTFKLNQKKDKEKSKGKSCVMFITNDDVTRYDNKRNDVMKKRKCLKREKENRK
jgi:hypothetical protein